MKSIARLLLAPLAVAATAYAEVPIYRGQHLDVPSAVVVTDTGGVYYGDVRFSANQDGSFSLVQAQRRNLAQVDNVSVSVDAASAQALVAAGGILSIACEALEEPAVLRDGNTFHVVLAETAQEPGEVCMSLLAVTEFEVDVPLDLTGLEAGSYDVVVNNLLRTSFTLDAD